LSSFEGRRFPPEAPENTQGTVCTAVEAGLLISVPAELPNISLAYRERFEERAGASRRNSNPAAEQRKRSFSAAASELVPEALRQLRDKGSPAKHSISSSGTERQ
jgi:hypothetical protein